MSIADIHNPLPHGLRVHEGNGRGHLITRHVEVNDNDLSNRIATENISGSSRFNDLSTAESVVRAALISNNHDIILWLTSPKKRTSITYTGNSTVIGRGVFEGSNEFHELYNAEVVIKKSNNGEFILTGYPTL